MMATRQSSISRILIQKSSNKSLEPSKEAHKLRFSWPYETPLSRDLKMVRRPLEKVQ